MKEGIASEYNAQLLVPESIRSRVQFNLLDETFIGYMFCVCSASRGNIKKGQTQSRLGFLSVSTICRKPQE